MSSTRAGDTPASPIRIGMLATMFRSGKPGMFAAFKAPFCSVVESQTGLESRLTMAPSLDEMQQQLSDGQLHFGLCHGFEFAWMRQRQPDLKPVMIAAPAVRPLKGFLVVVGDSPAKSLDDLKGKTIALPHGLHETARLFAHRECHCPSTGSSPHFEQIVRPVNAETALHNLYDDKVQAAIIDSAGMQCFAERYPARFKRIRTLIESQAFPMTVVVVREGVVSSPIIRKFRDGMAKAHRSNAGRQLMSLMQSSGFEPLPPDYERQLAEIARTYPPPEDTK
jgi:ABC-type phosphate/phosphonate transport system substrate-binding protein